MDVCIYTHTKHIHICPRRVPRRRGPRLCVGGIWGVAGIWGVESGDLGVQLLTERARARARKSESESAHARERAASKQAREFLCSREMVRAKERERQRETERERETHTRRQHSTKQGGNAARVRFPTTFSFIVAQPPPPPPDAASIASTTNPLIIFGCGVCRSYCETARSFFCPF